MKHKVKQLAELYKVYKENNGSMTWNEFQCANKTLNRYCTNIENVENYEQAKADNFKGWHLHHRLETHTSDGNLRSVAISRKELIALDMYYDRPACELIYLTKPEHTALHSHFIDRNAEKISRTLKLLWQDPEYRQHMSNTHKGHTYNKGRVLSEETRKKLSEAHKGKPSNQKGRHWKLVDGKRVYY